jgi:hypothetical protein
MEKLEEDSKKKILQFIAPNGSKWIQNSVHDDKRQKIQRTTVEKNNDL